MESWLRPHFTPGGPLPKLFYAVFGSFPRAMPPLSRVRYRSQGLPAGVIVSKQDASKFREGPLWEALQEHNPRCARAVAVAPACMAVKGRVEEPEMLDYLRDTIGLVTYLLDQGGVALYDPVALRWWEPSEWKTQAFRPGEPRPRTHVTVLATQEEGGTIWLHTRGMLKFGRPDLSMRGVARGSEGLYTELFNRFIEYQALGGVIEEGREVRMAGLRSGLRCFHKGSQEDPDFNNVHIEIR